MGTQHGDLRRREELEVLHLVRTIPSASSRTLGEAVPATDVYRYRDPLPGRRPEALEVGPSAPRQVSNRIPDEVREQIIDLAFDTAGVVAAGTAKRFSDKGKLFLWKRRSGFSGARPGCPARLRGDEAADEFQGQERRRKNHLADRLSRL